MKNLFVFDIETIIDERAAKRFLDMPTSTPRAQTLEALSQHYLKETDGKNDFARQPFHQIVAISFLHAQIEREDGKEFYHLQEIRSGGTLEFDEAKLILGFFQYVEQTKPRLVSFNGRGFDLPVIKYRAMKHGISPKWFYSNDKYAYRYSHEHHCDLLDQLSDYGASARIKMQEACAMLEIPNKLGCDGSQIEALYNLHKLNEVRDYCELDVVATYLIYLNFARHRGICSHEAFNFAKEDLLQYLDMHKDEKQHFGKFLESYNA